MRAAWLCTRDGTRRLTAEEPQDGQYREAASLEERAVDTAVSAVEAAVGATLRGGKKLAQQAAQKQRTEKADGKPEQTVGQATGTDTQPTTVAPGNTIYSYVCFGDVVSYFDKKYSQEGLAGHPGCILEVPVFGLWKV